MEFQLNPQLQADCYLLGTLGGNTLLLHKNALVPWFILVPDTQEVELYKLPAAQQSTVQSCINQLALFVDQYFTADKLNIATIGNIVPQLHIHIIGRHINDFCWPNPVWGQQQSSQYAAKDIQAIKQALSSQVHLFQLCN